MTARGQAWVPDTQPLPRDVDLGSASKPCTADPDAWYVTLPELVAVAVEACRHCALRVPCAEVAELLDEVHGVWGGIDRAALAEQRRNAKREKRQAARAKGGQGGQDQDQGKARRTPTPTTSQQPKQQAKPRAAAATTRTRTATATAALAAPSPRDPSRVDNHPAAGPASSEGPTSMSEHMTTHDAWGDRLKTAPPAPTRPPYNKTRRSSDRFTPLVNENQPPMEPNHES